LGDEEFALLTIVVRNLHLKRKKIVIFLRSSAILLILLRKLWHISIEEFKIDNARPHVEKEDISSHEKWATPTMGHLKIN
jgi:hypothetical protein